jgi:hypothetical protein
VASKDSKMSKQCTTGKRKRVILTIPHKLELSRNESGENLRDITPLYDTGSSAIYDIKKQKEQLQSFMASSGSLKDILK